MIKSKFVLVAAVVLALNFVTAAYCQEDEGQPAEMVFNDPEQVIEVTSGEIFAIGLKGNKTTGYTWQMTEPAEGGALEPMGYDYVIIVDDLLGSGGEERFKFKAVISGSYTMVFSLIRPWERNTKPVKTAKFFVDIKDSGEGFDGTETEE